MLKFDKMISTLFLILIWFPTVGFSCELVDAGPPQIYVCKNQPKKGKEIVRTIKDGVVIGEFERDMARGSFSASVTTSESVVTDGLAEEKQGF